jgi:hypothetical protein
MLNENNLILKDIKEKKDFDKENFEIVYFTNNKKILVKKKIIIYSKDGISLFTKINIGLIICLFKFKENLIIKKNQKKINIKNLYNYPPIYENSNFIIIKINSFSPKFNNFCSFTLADFYNNKDFLKSISKITKKKIDYSELKNNINLINKQYNKYLNIYKNIKIKDDILLKFAVIKYLNIFEKTFFILLLLTPKIIKKILRTNISIKYRTPLNRFAAYDNYLKTILKNVF